ncbi:hypothetical protein [Bradyrhizobium sp. BR 1432]|uniref:hypothetical protein n=1 Tax=Bradyrhizobium sp. BR 1432 TaxID=3447966 RepID=UPI003EE4301E
MKAKTPYQISLGFGLAASLAHLIRPIKKIQGGSYLLELLLDPFALPNILGRIKLLDKLLLSGKQIFNDRAHPTSVDQLAIHRAMLFSSLSTSSAAP